MHLHWIIGISILCIETVAAQSQRANELPIILTDDDPLLAKVILQLIEAVKAMTTGVQQQRSETRALTDALLNCEACKAQRPPPPTPPPRIPGFCDSNPCYPGVHCNEDEDLGYRCGACPSGYTGDGRSCRVVTRGCADRPCYVSVQCYDEPRGGFRCGPCPSGFDGDGQTCTRRRVCQTKACYDNDGQYIGEPGSRSFGSRRRFESFDVSK